ncbi:MAG: glutaredoxin domain-containing protein [Stellaceae bacterium]
MRVKEYLAVRGIAFESINVLSDERGLAELRRLGASSVPVVARGGRFVFAQVIGDVAGFLGLDEKTGPALSPAELYARCDRGLDAAIRLVRQMPDERLENILPNRPRSWRVLMHHIFQIPTAFLDSEDTGAALTYENLTAPPPSGMRTGAAIAAFGEGVRARLGLWWRRAAGGDFARPVPAYFGETSRHEMFERTVWHSVQHTRQLAALLEEAGIIPDRPLGRADIAGLPLTDRIWDEG